MKLVLEASVALSWLFKRVNPDECESANQALLLMTTAEVLVPALWHIEVANALLLGERRHVVTEAKVIDYLNKLSELPIITENASPSGRRDFVMSLAREYALTAYDATYLELALRIDGVLATFDKKLANAMESAGGSVFKHTQR